MSERTDQSIRVGAMDADTKSMCVLFGVLVLALGAWLGWNWWTSTGRPLMACENVIKDKLKAPSTYNRISSDGHGDYFSIEYEAQNSFGVPIRSKAACLIDGAGYASVYE